MLLLGSLVCFLVLIAVFDTKSSSAQFSPSKHLNYSPFLFSGIEPVTRDHLACNGSHHGNVEQSGEGKSSEARDVEVYVMVALNKGIDKCQL